MGTGATGGAGAIQRDGAVVRDGGGAIPSGSGLMRSGQMDGVGCGNWVLEAGDNGMAAMAGVAGAAGDRRALSAARVSIRAGAGGWGKEGGMGAAGSRGGSGAEGMGSGGNEAARGACAWAYSYCGYKLLIAALNSCQDSGSSNVSRVADHVSQDSSFV